ncbi:hypothetical protein CEXT_369721 [Caerostris extrusa]|uniref:Uncharacterized protein n=1 Tax=Caerostris extrusa TaxID=172846 RepID=A0AAV4UPA8_CAEEX|nr:hypothetical protein CEXT_369721 [Caerostris extrusa]
MCSELKAKISMQFPLPHTSLKGLIILRVFSPKLLADLTFTFPRHFAIFLRALGNQTSRPVLRRTTSRATVFLKPRRTHNGKMSCCTLFMAAFRNGPS